MNFCHVIYMMMYFITMVEKLKCTSTMSGGIIYLFTKLGHIISLFEHIISNTLICTSHINNI